MATWSNQSKSNHQLTIGSPIGLLLCLTHADDSDAWENGSKGTATWTNSTISGLGGLTTGSPIGLLLALTYENNWSATSKSNSSWSHYTFGEGLWSELTTPWTLVSPWTHSGSGTSWDNQSKS